MPGAGRMLSIPSGPFCRPEMRSKGRAGLKLNVLQIEFPLAQVSQASRWFNDNGVCRVKVKICNTFSLSILR